LNYIIFLKEKDNNNTNETEIFFEEKISKIEIYNSKDSKQKFTIKLENI
jgi:hypothetical protein